MKDVNSIYRLEREKYNRKERLAKAAEFQSSYKRDKLINKYCEWFGVNSVCALEELELLGHSFHPDHKKQVRKSYEKKCREAKRKEKSLEAEAFESTQNGEFYFIAGYTSGGVPFGITWEQHERELAEEKGEKLSQKETLDSDEDLAEVEIPF